MHAAASLHIISEMDSIFPFENETTYIQTLATMQDNSSILLI